MFIRHKLCTGISVRICYQYNCNPRRPMHTIKDAIYKQKHSSIILIQPTYISTIQGYATSTKASNQPPSNTSSATKAAHQYAWAVTDVPPPSPGHGLLGKASNVDVTKGTGKWLPWLFKLIKASKEEEKTYSQSVCMLQSCVNQTGKPEFYQALELEPTFRSQQTLLMAHVWIIHRRLSFDDKDTRARLMQEQMFDRLWEETMVRIRHQNISEMTVNKHLGEVQQMCFNACLAYDKGLKADQEANTKSALEKSVAEHLLWDSNSVHAKRMAEYMRQQLQTLANVDTETIMDGTIPWGKPPAPLPNASRKAMEGFEDVVLVGQKFGDWRSALDNRGKMYYWHKTTRYSVWELPEDVRKQQSV